MVEEAILAMVMTLTMASVRKTCRAVRKGQGMGREHRMGWGQGREGEGKR